MVLDPRTFAGLGITIMISKIYSRSAWSTYRVRHLVIVLVERIESLPLGVSVDQPGSGPTATTPAHSHTETAGGVGVGGPHVALTH